MTLNLDSFDKSPKKKTKYKAALGVGSVVSLFGLGSTLAANISLNGGGNVEFGQGVATTAACDEDGFNVTPHTSYDNDHSIFRVDYVQVTGLDLTPEGTGYSAAGYGSQAAAKTAHPGEYYVNGDWKRTCDNVVLDFKAYTSDPEYAQYTDDAYDNPSNTAITSPVAWSQGFDNNSPQLDWIESAGFAVIFDSNDEGSSYDWNSAVYANEPNNWHGMSNDVYVDNYNNSSLWTSQAEFNFRSNNAPNAASISKITVQSMNSFPTSYYANNGAQNGEGLGNPSGGWWN
jgi:hypothetical protein